MIKLSPAQQWALTRMLVHANSTAHGTAPFEAGATKVTFEILRKLGLIRRMPNCWGLFELTDLGISEARKARRRIFPIFDLTEEEAMQLIEARSILGQEHLCPLLSLLYGADQSLRMKITQALNEVAKRLPSVLEDWYYTPGHPGWKAQGKALRLEWIDALLDEHHRSNSNE